MGRSGYGVTHQALVEMFVLPEDKRILDGISAHSADWNKYSEINTKAGQTVDGAVAQF
jgi:hypothetical protein